MASPGEDSIEREVWLKAGGKRLVYARSVFPSSPYGGKFSRVLKTSRKPIGSVLSLENIGVRREAFEIAVIRDKRISKGFGLKKKFLFSAAVTGLSGLRETARSG